MSNAMARVSSCAARDGSSSIDDIAKVVVSTRGGTPVRVEDIAEVGVGRELRMGSASMNGEEVVIGTALMLIGANSREVSSAVNAKMDEIRRLLPPGVEVRTILNRTLLVNATIKTVAMNLVEGAALVILVLFVMLDNFRAALVTAMVIPLTMLLLGVGMYVGKISANLMSFGALDFGLIADGAIIVIENCLRRLSQRQNALGRTLTLEERLTTVIDSAVEMRRPTVYGQAIIILVYVPILTFSGVEGKMFHPMAMTVIMALASRIRSVADVLSGDDRHRAFGTLARIRKHVVDGLKRAYEPILKWAMAAPLKPIAIGAGAFVLAALLYPTLGEEFVPTLDEKNLAMQANRIPSASLTQSQAMQFEIESALRSFPEVDYVFSKTGTAEIATDPMPPNLTDTFIMLKPRENWPDPALDKAALIEKMERATHATAGQRL